VAYPASRQSPASSRAAATASADSGASLATVTADLAAPGGRLDHAVRQVVVEQPERDGLKRLGRRRHPGQDVDAVLVVLDHLLQAADLALDLAIGPEWI
jgi:hypothetical protein